MDSCCPDGLELLVQKFISGRVSNENETVRLGCKRSRLQCFPCPLT